MYLVRGANSCEHTGSSYERAKEQVQMACAFLIAAIEQEIPGSGKKRIKQPTFDAKFKCRYDMSD